MIRVATVLLVCFTFQSGIVRADLEEKVEVEYLPPIQLFQSLVLKTNKIAPAKPKVEDATDKLAKIRQQYRVELQKAGAQQESVVETLARKEKEIEELKAVVKSLTIQLEKAEKKIYSSEKVTPPSLPGANFIAPPPIPKTPIKPGFKRTFMDTGVPEIEPIVYGRRSAVNYSERERVLSELIEVQSKSATAKFRIIGHADDFPHETTNQEVSWNRARFLAAFLKNNGIEPARLYIESKGSSVKPTDGSTTNRRVEIIVE